MRHHNHGQPPNEDSLPASTHPDPRPPGREAFGWPRPERLQQPMVALAIFVLLGLIVPCGLIGLGWKTHGPAVLLIFPLVLALYLSGRMAWEVAQPTPNQLRIFFYVFAYVSFGSSPIPQILNERFPWRGTYSVGDIIITYLYVIAGLAAFEGVCRLRRVRPAARPPGASALEVRVPGAVVACAVGLCLLSMLLSYISGWYTVMFQSRMEASLEIYGQFGAESAYQLMTRSMHGFSLVGCLVLVLAAWGDSRRDVLSKWGLRALSLVFVAYTLVLSNPISTARSWFATVLISLAGAACVLLWPSLRRYFGPITAVGYLFVFPLADIFRSQYDLAAFQQNQTYSVTENVAESFFNGDFDSLQQVMNSRRAVDAEGYQYGGQMLGTALFWFPRSVWPDKPINSGDWVAASVGYGYTNLSCPLWAEGIVDFGFPGTLAYLAAYAWLVQWFYRRETQASSTAIYYTVAVLILAPYSIYLLRGGLLSCVAYITPAMLAVGLLVLLQKFLAEAPRAPIR